MGQKTAFLIAVVLFFSCPCFADTIYLKSGKKIEGQILSQTDKETKISVRGITLTYDAYDIERVEKAVSQDMGVVPVKKEPSGSQPLKAMSPVLPQVITPSPSAAVGQSSPPAVDPSLSSQSKAQLISDLIDASGARENMNQMFGQIVSQASPQDSDKLRGLFNVDEVIAQLVPIYDRYFTEEELKGLVTFYRSALGRKLLMVTPQIMQDSMETSMAYFQKKMEGITLSGPEEQPPAPGVPGQGQ